MYTVEKIAKLLLFYFIFYCCLSALVAVLMVIFLNTLDAKEPKWQLDSSLIGSNPGLGFKPNIRGSNFIAYSFSDNETAGRYIVQLDEFLEPYVTPEYSDSGWCNHFVPARPDESCELSIWQYWGPCTKENGYGYGLETAGPCIFFKLNKVFGWIPDSYNSSTIPNDMPDELKAWITVSDLQEQHGALLDCSGETSTDTENMGQLTYYPHRAFPAYHFPYKNTRDYLSPLVAVRFEQPKHNVVINIVCKVWARNIQHQVREQKGSVRMRLLLIEEN